MTIVTLLFDMFTVQDLTQRFSLTANQVRDRLTLLEGLIDSHVIRGKQNAKLLTDAGLAIFDRLIQLEREGIPATSAVKMIQDESLKQQNTAVNQNEINGQSADYAAELVRQMSGRIESLERDKMYLQAKLDEAIAKLPALPAPRSQPQQPLNRWQAFRIALLGR